MPKVFIVGASLETAEEFMSGLDVVREDWEYVESVKQVKRKSLKTIPFYIIYGFVKPNIVKVINHLNGKGNQELTTTNELINYLKEVK